MDVTKSSSKDTNDTKRKQDAPPDTTAAIDGPRFATLNVRGFNSRKKQYQLKRLLEDKEVDFLA
ncbi:hypothetical protein HPB47_000898 [Ixodes persulcatus]|uniref:Uncharacterized protein n=1 Tax=Ixodes persulcatus TaxID=34615 RepID=A0AC60PS64_IXOPE|nr:hypothetical protein HPB47_000898 [Ixodes persulcatus]